MADETLVLTLTDVSPKTTSTGKNLHQAHDAEFFPAKYPCWSIWDADTAATLTALVGQTVTVKVNRDNADFPAIKKFVKAGGAAPTHAAAPAQAPPTPPASSSPGTAAAPATAGSGGASTFKRDPIGMTLNMRQTALNCATQWMVSHNEKLPGEEKLGTAHLMKCADVLFRHLVRGFEDYLGVPAGPKTQDTGPGGVPDDDIPF